MTAFNALGRTSEELSISEGRVGIEERRLPKRGDAEGDTDGVTLLTGVKEFGVGDVEEADRLALLALFERSFLLGVEGGWVLVPPGITASLTTTLKSTCCPRRRSKVPVLLPGDEAEPEPDSMDDVMDAGKEEEEEVLSAPVTPP